MSEVKVPRDALKKRFCGGLRFAPVMLPRLTAGDRESAIEAISSNQVSHPPKSPPWSGNQNWFCVSVKCVSMCHALRNLCFATACASLLKQSSFSVCSIVHSKKWQKQ